MTFVAAGSGTRVLFGDDGHDAPYRVKKIEARLLDDTLKWLHRQARGSGSVTPLNGSVLTGAEH